MFMVTESDAAAIQAAFDQSGELAAAVELRRRFKGITDNEKARACVRSIVGWRQPAEPTGETRRDVGKAFTQTSAPPNEMRLSAEKTPAGGDRSRC